MNGPGLQISDGQKALNEIGKLRKRVANLEQRLGESNPLNARVSDSDGTDELCNALYGRKAKPEDYLGGSDAKMLRDAAKVVRAARKIKHWHNTGRNDEGMVVSAKHVRLLWEALPEEH